MVELCKLYGRCFYGLTTANVHVQMRVIGGGIALGADWFDTENDWEGRDSSHMSTNKLERKDSSSSSYVEAQVGNNDV